MQSVRGTQALVEFSYESSVARDLPHAALLRLARQAWSYNQRTGLTGFLRFAGDRIEQTIEGSPQVILPLAARILADTRHEAIHILSFRSIEARQFANWTCSGVECESADPVAIIGVANLLHLPLAAARRAAAGVIHEAALGTS